MSRKIRGNSEGYLGEREGGADQQPAPVQPADFGLFRPSAAASALGPAPGEDRIGVVN